MKLKAIEIIVTLFYLIKLVNFGFLAISGQDWDPASHQNTK